MEEEEVMEGEEVMEVEEVRGVEEVMEGKKKRRVREKGCGKNDEGER